MLQQKVKKKKLLNNFSFFKPQQIFFSFKLSFFLDLVEIELIKQISLRSDVFFYALTTIRMLHDQITESCKEISKLRKHVSNIKNEVVYSFRVPQLKRKKEKAELTLVYLEKLAEIHRTTKLIDSFIKSKDYPNAFLMIEIAKSKTFDLEGIDCIK